MNDGYFNDRCLICGAHVPDSVMVDHYGFWPRAGVTYGARFATQIHDAWHQQNGEGVQRTGGTA